MRVPTAAIPMVAFLLTGFWYQKGEILAIPPTIAILSTNPEVLTASTSQITILCALSSLQSGVPYRAQIYLNNQLIKTAEVPESSYLLSLVVDIPPLLIPQLLANGQTTMQIRAVLADQLVALASATTIVTIVSPLPFITDWQPRSVSAGGPDLSFTLLGGGFVDRSLILMNGVTQTTSFVNVSKLKMTVHASDIASAGSLRFAINNPSPGGGTSNEILLTISPPGVTTSSTFMTSTSLSMVTSTTHPLATTTTLIYLPSLHKPTR